MFMTTVQSLPGIRYQILDTVYSVQGSLSGVQAPTRRALAAVKQTAQQMGADGVIGLQFNTAIGTIMVMFTGYSVTVAGTAIKMLPPDPGQSDQVVLPAAAIPSRAPLVPAMSPTPAMPQPGYYPPTAPFFSPEAPHSEPSWRR